jgi:hypothetical protein
MAESTVRIIGNLQRGDGMGQAPAAGAWGRDSAGIAPPSRFDQMRGWLRKCEQPTPGGRAKARWPDLANGQTPQEMRGFQIVNVSRHGRAMSGLCPNSRARASDGTRKQHTRQGIFLSAPREATTSITQRLAFIQITYVNVMDFQIFERWLSAV